MELNKLLQHLNSVHPNVQFTMEKEQSGKLPFLDVLMNRKNNGNLGHTVYRKMTDTDLHRESNHHPGQKRTVLKTLVKLAERICEPDNVKDELKHLGSALQANGYSAKEVRRALHPNKKPTQQSTEE